MAGHSPPATPRASRNPAFPLANGTAVLVAHLFNVQRAECRLLRGRESPHSDKTLAKTMYFSCSPHQCSVQNVTTHRPRLYVDVIFCICVCYYSTMTLTNGRYTALQTYIQPHCIANTKCTDYQELCIYLSRSGNRPCTLSIALLHHEQSRLSTMSASRQRLT